MRKPPFKPNNFTCCVDGPSLDVITFCTLAQIYGQINETTLKPKLRNDRCDNQDFHQKVRSSQGGFTALFFAALGGRREIVKLLLERHADVSHITRVSGKGKRQQRVDESAKLTRLT